MSWPYKKTLYQALIVVGILFAFVIVLTCGFIQWFGHGANASSSVSPAVCPLSSAFGLTKLSEENLSLVVFGFALILALAMTLASDSSRRLFLSRHRGMWIYFRSFIIGIITPLEEGFRRGILQPKIYSYDTFA